MSRSKLTRTLAFALAPIVCAFVAGPACAVLGDVDASVMTDSVLMRAQLRSTTNTTHTVRQLTLPNGGAVKEYVNQAGAVFAVTWDGPGKPDLRMLLGRHFDAMQADNAGVGRGGRRRPAIVNRADLRIQNGGHPGHFWGAAFLPRLAPVGFSVNDLAGA